MSVGGRPVDAIAAGPCLVAAGFSDFAGRGCLWRGVHDLPAGRSGAVVQTPRRRADMLAVEPGRLGGGAGGGGMGGGGTRLGSYVSIPLLGWLAPTQAKIKIILGRKKKLFSFRLDLFYFLFFCFYGGHGKMSSPNYAILSLWTDDR